MATSSGSPVRVLLLAVAVLALTAAAPECLRPPFDPDRASPDNAAAGHTTIVVRAKRVDDFARIEAYANGRGYRVVGTDERLRALRVAAPAGTGVVRAVTDFTARPGVLYAEPSYTFTSTDTPGDPLYSRQRAYLEAVNAPKAWDIEKGKPGAIVAVLDTGVDVTHPDLAGRIWTNAREIAGNGADDDSNGCTDDVHGCAFVAYPLDGCAAVSGGDVRDDAGHGTFVAGIIAANGNAQGIVGVARGATVMPVKVLDCEGAGDSLSLAQGILYAAANGARVINLSLGNDEDSLIVKEAVRIAREQHSALVVAASGNTGGAGVVYPARYPDVLAVGASSYDDPLRAAPFTTSGPEVDVVAVGEKIVGPVPADVCGIFIPCIGELPYASGGGTSFSAPQVAGLAALILSRRPNTTPEALISIIKATARPVPAGGPEHWAGAGLIDMARALEPQFRLGVPGTAKN